MSYIPPQDYEYGTVWVPLYINGQIFMIPIQPTRPPLSPKPKPYNPYDFWEHPMGGDQRGVDPYEQEQRLRGEIRRRFHRDD